LLAIPSVCGCSKIGRAAEMNTEDDLLPISALQHLLFCERQCALIHVEQVWAENRFTVEGQHLHRKADEETTQRRNDLRIARGLSLRSFRLGLIGKADVVEFRPLDDLARENVARRRPLSRLFAAGTWSVVPVEYKRGKPKKDASDRVQLCAQAICLEEMLGVAIQTGELFYGRQRRRTMVAIDEPLRERTAAAAHRLRELITSRQTPPARREPKCERCSLLSICLPDAMGHTRGMADWVARSFQHHLVAAAPQSDPESALA
jgi:CRISPR-associated exonuclease Cas4